jgi:hypothetical protein
MNPISFKKNKGFSMPEILVYIAIMTVVMFVIVNVVLVVSKSLNKSSEYNNIKNSAISGLEKITKETRLSTSIDLNSSVFNSPSGVLVLNSKDENGLLRVTKFYLDGDVVKVFVDGNYLNTITYSDTKVLSLYFVPIETGNSQAVKIEMVVGSENENSQISERFYSTVVLRNSY